jgi:hypothetical protein
VTYSIFDNGNLVVSFDREDEAHHAFERFAHETSHPDDLMLLTFADDGTIVDELDGSQVAPARS